FIQPVHIGAVEQIHFLADQAAGDYIALLNSDDYWKSDKLEKQITYLEEHCDVDACFTQALMVDKNGKLITKEEFSLSEIFLQPNRTRKEWLRFFVENGNALCHPSIVARKGLYQGKYRLNHGLRQLPDYDLWTRYLMHHNIHVIQEPLTFHRRTGSLNTSAWSKNNLALLLREQAWIRRHMIDNMGREDFVEIFRDQLKKTDCSDIEMICEKFFLLVRMGQHDTAMLDHAIDFYFDHATDHSFVQTMSKSYSFSDTDFFAISHCNSKANDTILGIGISSIWKKIASFKKREEN
ncbi:MAG: glycosyltransferase, partial [Clostridia bacterium]|nr:glycosyltransferase [Clostridia bacterium]